MKTTAILKLKLKLNQIYLYRHLAFKKHKYDVLKNPKKEANRIYKPFFKKEINFENPKNLIEKIFWLQFNTDTRLWTKYADKYLVRNYIKECGYEEYLPKLYGKWENPKDINFDKLPNSFVLKANNGCGTVMIVKDKVKLNYKKTRKTLKQWLSIPYGYSGAQLHYLKIKPIIIAEELLEKTDNFSKSLVDYKILCLNGKAEFIWVAYNRSQNGVDMTLYDLEWNKMPEKLISSKFFRYNSKDINRPKSLSKMIEIAEKLSKGLPQVRVDLYDVNDKPYIGEMTFTTGFGFFTEEYYNYLGNKVDLNINM
jgi:hypothetical protein